MGMHLADSWVEPKVGSMVEHWAAQKVDSRAAWKVF